MANWKKMAEAFGRAFTDPGMQSKYGSGLIKHGAEPTTSYDLDVTKSGRIVNNNKSFNKDIADAFERGKVEGIIEDTDRMGKGISRDERKRLFDESSDRLTDEALQQDFDEAFDEVTKTDGLREEAIKMLKNGTDISDVFEYLRRR